MKNLVKVFSILLIALFAFSLVSCNKENEEPKKEDPIQLSSPVVSIDETGLASWEVIQNASGYVVKVNNVEREQSGVNYQLNDGEAIMVKAKGDGTNYSDSEYSSSKTYTAPAPLKHFVSFMADGELVSKVEFTEGDASVTEPQVPAKDLHTGAWDSYTLGTQDITVNAIYTQVKLAAPIISLEGAKVSWDEVSNATSYDVLNGETLVANVTECEYTFTATGNYEVTVIAKGSIEASAKSNKVDVKVTEKLNAPSVSVNDEGLASWTAISNAEGYGYSINGGTQVATLQTSVQLADGDSIVVVAFGDDDLYLDSDPSTSVTYTKPVHYGLPELEEGFYMKDADVIEINDVRYLVYTTNKTKADEDNVIALRVGEYVENHGWLYGEQTILVEPNADGWDKYIGSASIVKGTFEMGGENYSWLIAYAGSTNEKLNASNIGLAVAKEINGTWVKVGTEPVIKYDTAFGTNMVGCYAPSVINYNKGSLVRIFYTYADAYGHFAKFFDADLADLDSIDGVDAYAVLDGNLQSGDAVLMFPNADMAYDSENGLFYAVKDYSPSAATTPAFANEFEICHIAEAELITTDEGNGWVSDDYKDYIDLGNGFDRCYSGAIVSDEYGHLLEGIEVVYTACKAGSDYMYTQHLESYVLELE